MLAPRHSKDTAHKQECGFVLVITQKLCLSLIQRLSLQTLRGTIRLDQQRSSKQRFQFCIRRIFQASKIERHPETVGGITRFVSKKGIQHSHQNPLLETDKQTFAQCPQDSSLPACCTRDSKLGFSILCQH